MSTRTNKLLLGSGFLLLLAWVVAHSVWIARDGLRDTAQPADCILVLGNKVNEDGTPSARLQARLDKALALYRARLAPRIVVSGALGTEGHYEGWSMRQYLLRQGVRRADILVDNAGNTTLATAANFGRIAAQRHFRSVIVVSQFYHLTRAKLLLQQAGNWRIFTAHASYFELRDIYSLLREFPAYYVAKLR
ncbi:YdcF family protein [Hymenobacter busanensis]|uniref:YdcF family protein n=1 Tax=Hymenobacter busanensis TaxID=2607656 RepID=A0A7L4ZRN1_9BACT|nr:YdcF family protein [Hymenobacter busanensis]KAA9327099.1 YdcF family protein [Hymenobacter busanensis]QHJ05764.1 YdcF family protein [Hymenobacter busanensis]